MRKGFTLVEMSIVLVVVGLLIGGILAGQSMIQTVKINRAISDFTSYETAATAFKAKFNQIPGDSNLFPTINWFGHVGNNNGIIHHMEGAAFWMHLSAGVGLRNKEGREFSAENTPVGWRTGPKLDLPQNKVPDFRLLAMSDTGNDAGTKNYWWHNQVGTGGIAPFRPVEMAAMDTKLDDGVYNAGEFQVWEEQYVCIDNGTYNLASQVFDCSFVYSMGTITGVK